MLVMLLLGAGEVWAERGAASQVLAGQPGGQTAISARAAAILYAKPGGLQSGNCQTNWANACELRYALGAVAGADTEIWAARGVYTAGATMTATFVLTNGMALYGGFAGTESLRSQRDIAANLTILSGDIDNNDIKDANGIVTSTTNIRGYNAYHVVTADGVTNMTVIDGVTITGGNASGVDANDRRGGGLRAEAGSPTLTSVVFSGNSAAVSGGGLFTSGSPTLTNVTFSGNRSPSNGGGMYIDTGNPMLTNVTFSSNSADGYGGGLYNFSGKATLTQGAFSNNRALTGGGGIVNSGALTVTQVAFSQNWSGYGGGIDNREGSLTLANVTFSRNSAAGGGGMRTSAGSAQLTNVTFISNTVSEGGGGMSCSTSAIIGQVTFIGNSAASGGGLANYASMPTLTNVTFANNSANYGGGVANFNSSNPTLINVTFSGNSATGTSYALGGGALYTAGSSVTIHNILAVKGAAGDNCAGIASFSATGATNLADDASCGGSVVQSANINLGGLGNYGGNTQTVPLLPGSAAIDAGDAAYCPPADQRGFGRVGQCDIGAYESPAWSDFLFLPLLLKN